MSYPPPNPNYPGGGGGNPPYNQQQPGSFGPPQGQGGNPPGMGYQPPQPGYGAPQGPPGAANYGSPSPPGTYGQQTYSSPNQAPNSYNSGNMGMGMSGAPMSPQGHSGMPPMGGQGPPSMGPGPPNMGMGMGPGPPGSGLGAGVSPPANRATFFSTASGAPIPSGLPMGGPPSSTGGGPAPPSFGVMPPPGAMGGPPNGPPGPGAGGPGNFYPNPNQMVGPPGVQGDYQSPPQLYGQGQSGPNSMTGIQPGYGANIDTNNQQNTQRQPVAGSSIFPGGGWGGASTSTKEPVSYEEQGGFNSNTLPLINEMDLTSECNPMFMRASVSKLVVSQAAATASKIPIGTSVRSSVRATVHTVYTCCVCVYCNCTCCNCTLRLYVHHSICQVLDYCGISVRSLPVLTLSVHMLSVRVQLYFYHYIYHRIYIMS
jgi:hypothetical protein